MKNGYTIIELMILIVIASIVVIIVASFVSTNKNSSTFGINGVTETRCIDGYKFVIGSDHQPRQIMDSFGKGVPCN
jgi:type II secretory pathway pseudopilin PulG